MAIGKPTWPERWRNLGVDSLHRQWVAQHELRNSLEREHDWFSNKLSKKKIPNKIELSGRFFSSIFSRRINSLFSLFPRVRESSLVKSLALCTVLAKPRPKSKEQGKRKNKFDLAKPTLHCRLKQRPYYQQEWPLSLFFRPQKDQQEGAFGRNLIRAVGGFAPYDHNWIEARFEKWFRSCSNYVLQYDSIHCHQSRHKKTKRKT